MFRIEVFDCFGSEFSGLFTIRGAPRNAISFRGTDRHHPVVKRSKQVYAGSILAAALGLGGFSPGITLRESLGLVRNDVVFMGGDSITSATMYSHYLLAWLQLTYPDLDLKTYAIGRSGTNISGWATAVTTPPLGSSSGLYEQFAAPFFPRVVFMMHGQNGGQTAAAHVESYGQLWNRWVKGESAAKLVMLGMHPVQNPTDNKQAEAKADAEAAFAATDPGVFSSHTFDFIGAAWLLNADNSIDIQQVGGKPFGGGDTVHPGPAGHVAIAWAALRGLNVESLVSTATIDFGSGELVSSVQCGVSNLKKGANRISFERMDESLPWAIDELGRENAIRLIPEIRNWQKYELRVINLPEGVYVVKCDDVEIGKVSKAELAAGWNMSDLDRGPVWEQCQRVLGAVRSLHGINPTTGAYLPSNANQGTVDDFFDWSMKYYRNSELRGSAYYQAVQPSIDATADLMRNVHAQAQPINRRFEVVRLAPSRPTGLNVEQSPSAGQ